MTGAERFEVLQVLGTGASGLVQEVRDHKRGGKVALKRLHRDGAMDVVRLREEFRSLSDVLHPHLVRLHELLVEGDQTLLTMDLVRGRSFLEYVWDLDLPSTRITTGQSWPTGTSDAPTADAPEPQEVDRPPIDDAMLQRLRTALRGLVDGLAALHGAGLLHRDVKPSNVLVEPDGHVVLVDFGLAMRSGTNPTAIAGTVPYMAPEQLIEEQLDARSDWYAVGAMLYECLTGRTPFVGSAAQMAFDKQCKVPPPLSELAPETPPDLAEAIEGLLRSYPDDRLDVVGLRRILDLPAPRDLAPAPFVGRAADLATLAEQLDGQGMRLVRVQGTSGLGKTRLVEQALQALKGRSEHEPFVLQARCYEREQAPFKAIDPLVNALVDRLLVDPLHASPPEDLASAARLFPSLSNLCDPLPIGDVDPLVLRARAVTALRLLLHQVATQRPTVLWIDDLQWADLASMRILAGLFAGDPQVPCALVLSHRDDDPRMSELLAPLEDHEATVVTLQPLPDDEARELASTMVDHPWLVQRVVREAGGSPFFLQEIGRWLGDHDGEEAGEEADSETFRLLDGLVANRVQRLTPDTRALLEVVAVAARPLEPSLALRAARADAPDTTAGAIATLTVQRLLTTRRGEAIECTHDRIREGLTALLNASRLAEVHRHLAEAIGPAGNAEVLSEHWEQAGDGSQAAVHARDAASQAADALDFERAAALYGRALRLGMDDPDTVQTTRIAFGHAKARAGQGDAADVLLEAAAAATSAAERLELERTACNQLLRAGHFDRAYQLLPHVLEQLGMRWPTSRAAAMAEYVLNTGRIRLPFLHPRSTSEEALDVAMELAMSIAYADMLRSAVFSTRAILMATASTRPEAQAVAYAMRCSNASLLGELEEAERCIREARARLPADASVESRASVDLHGAIHVVRRGAYAEAMQILDSVVQRLEAVAGHPYEIDMAQTFLLFTVLSTGRVAEFRDLRARCIESCKVRGAKHFQVFHQIAYALPPALMDDDPEAEAANIADAESSWGEGTSTVWLYTEAAKARLDIYRGRHRAALDRIEAAYPLAKRNGLLNIDFNLNVTEVMRAAAAAPLAGTDPSARRVLDKAVHNLDGIRMGIAEGSLHTWQALQHILDGDPRAALVANEQARLAAESVGTPWQVAMVDIQRAWLTGDDPSEPVARLASMGMADPIRITTLYAWAPGGPAPSPM